MSITDAVMEAVQSLPDDKQQEVLDFVLFLHARSTGEAPAILPQPKVPLPPQGNLAALLEQWRSEDATDDPEVLRASQVEIDEFKKNMNANRAATGERLLFP